MHTWIASLLRVVCVGAVAGILVLGAQGVLAQDPDDSGVPHRPPVLVEADIVSISTLSIRGGKELTRAQLVCTWDWPRLHVLNKQQEVVASLRIRTTKDGTPVLELLDAAGKRTWTTEKTLKKLK
jgi:hypothetical protein